MTENVLDGRDFAELILRDLINEGYGGKELFDEFNIRQSKIRPRVEAMLREAKNVAHGKGEYETYNDVFGNEEGLAGISYSSLWQIKVKKKLKALF